MFFKPGVTRPSDYFCAVNRRGVEETRIALLWTAVTSAAGSLWLLLSTRPRIGTTCVGYRVRSANGMWWQLKLEEELGSIFGARLEYQGCHSRGIRKGSNDCLENDQQRRLL